MASEERDRSFDQALRRHLRSAAPANEAANGPAASTSETSACLDAETLAAYHERSLLPGELNSSKEHIVGCQKCQLILSHLEETDAIALEASEEKKVFRENRPASVAAPASRAAAPMAAVAGRAEQKPIADTSRPDRTRRLRLLHGTRWRWLAPAGAIAAGLLVWIALHENQPALHSVSEESKIAKNLPASTPPIPPKPALATPPSSNAIRTTQPVPNEVASSDGRAESYGLAQKQKQVLTAPSKAAPVTAYADKESVLRKDARREKGDVLRRAEPERDLDAKTVNGAVEQKVELQAQAPPPSRSESPAQVQAQEQASNIQNQTNANMQKVLGPAPLGQATEARRMKASSPATAAPVPPTPAPGGVAGTTMNYQSADSLQLTKMSDARLIVAPGSTVIWRTGPAGLIEFSSDKGTSWSPQTSGVLVDLVTGSAASDKVCWVVGRAGAVLRTTDGGAHWKTLAFPLTEDLGGIRATDALHATVWNLRHTKSFETTDGGVTWKRAANP
jgi:hypothetical protein